jgi:hypothetical protein
MSGYWKGQILDAKGWSCPESSELSEYARTLRDGLRWNQLEKTVENLQHVVDDMNNMIELRNVAVHRNYITGLKLRMLLRAAASTVQALGDDSAFDILFKIMGIVWSRQSEIIDGMRRGETAFQEAISRRPVTVTVAGEPLDIWKNIRQAESDACERLEEEIGKLMDDVVPSPLGNERQVDPNSRRLPLQSNYWHRQRIFSP